MKKFTIKNGLFVLLLTVIGIAGAVVSYKAPEESNRVSISGRQILVNNSPYIIKGICYHPVPKGSDQRSFESLTQDLKLMNEAGINTMRVYAPIDDIEVLDALIDSVRFDNKDSGYNYMIAAFHESDPLYPVVKRYSSVKYTSVLFVVEMEPEKKYTSTLDKESVPYVEIGTL